jgi:hypothetical protein
MNRYSAPLSSEVDEQLSRLMQSRKENDSALKRSLEHYGFTMEDLREELIYQVALLRFVDFRFSPGIEVSDQEIEAAYNKEIVPEAQKRDATPPSLDEARPNLTRLLSYRKTTAAMESWLAQARQQVKIRYIEEAFQ